MMCWLDGKMLKPSPVVVWSEITLKTSVPTKLSDTSRECSTKGVEPIKVQRRLSAPQNSQLHLGEAGRGPAETYDGDRQPMPNQARVDRGRASADLGGVRRPRTCWRGPSRCCTSANKCRATATNRKGMLLENSLVTDNSQLSLRFSGVHTGNPEGPNDRLWDSGRQKPGLAATATLRQRPPTKCAKPVPPWNWSADPLGANDHSPSSGPAGSSAHLEGVLRRRVVDDPADQCQQAARDLRRWLLHY